MFGPSRQRLRNGIAWSTYGARSEEHAVSAYDCEAQSAVSAALRALEDRAQGLTADTCITPKGCFAEFQWPDWPPQLSADLGKRVDFFRNQHCEIRPIAAESAEWNGVFHGWC